MQKEQNKQDEIDLIELFKALWQKKVWIILTAFVTTLFAGVYAFTAKEQWTSTAVVLAAEPVNFANYLEIRREYNRILRIDPIDTSALSQSLFDKFQRLSKSADERREFLLSSEVYSSLSKDKNDEQKQVLLSQFITENIKVTKPDLRKDPNALGITISLSAETAIDAQKTLSGFVNAVNKSAFKLELDNFLFNFQNTLTALNYEKGLIQQDLSTNNAVKIENLANAYDIAQKAGIKEYSKGFSGIGGTNTIALPDAQIAINDTKLADGSYLFMLGKKYLKAQIDIAKEKGIIYPPRYYQIDYQLKQLEPLFEKTKQATANTYQYLNSPDYPIKRDWPKRFLLLIVGAFIGGIIGSAIVIAKFLVKRVNNERY